MDDKIIPIRPGVRFLNTASPPPVYSPRDQALARAHREELRHYRRRRLNWPWWIPFAGGFAAAHLLNLALRHLGR